MRNTIKEVVERPCCHPIKDLVKSKSPKLPALGICKYCGQLWYEKAEYDGVDTAYEWAPAICVNVAAR